MSGDKPSRKVLRRVIFISTAIIVMAVVFGGGFLVGANAGFNTGKAYTKLYDQEMRARQVLYALWAVLDGNVEEVQRRLDYLLDFYLEDRMNLYKQVPLWLAPGDDAFPMHYGRVGQLDAMIYDHLTMMGDGGLGKSPLSNDEDLLNSQSRETRSRYMEEHKAILQHLASRYDAALYQEKWRKEPDEPQDDKFQLYESVDGSVAHNIEFEDPVLPFEVVGDATIGKGGVLWAKVKVSSGETGFTELYFLKNRLKVPWWRLLIYYFPGY